MSQFAKLLAELDAASAEQDTLAKSLPAEGSEDDEAIQAAAAESGQADPNPEDDEDDGEEKPPMAKSVTATVDGEEVEAIDATEIIKSLSGRMDSTEATLAKALQTTIGMVKSQNEVIKSMAARMDKLASQGKGRKTVLTIAEKPVAGETMTKSEQPEGLTPQEFMAKANAAFSAGKLSGHELTTADVAIRSGAPIPAGIIAKALS